MYRWGQGITFHNIWRVLVNSCMFAFAYLNKKVGIKLLLGLLHSVKAKADISPSRHLGGMLQKKCSPIHVAECALFTKIENSQVVIMKIGTAEPAWGFKGCGHPGARCISLGLSGGWQQFGAFPRREYRNPNKMIWSGDEVPFNSTSLFFIYMPPGGWVWSTTKWAFPHEAHLNPICVTSWWKRM